MSESYRENTFDDSHSNLQSLDLSTLTPRIAILGASYVGKSQIYNQILNIGFREDLDQGFLEEQRIEVEYNSTIKQFQLVDVPGIYSDCTPFLKDCAGYLLVFSLDDELSFQRMQELYKSIIKINGKSMRKRIIVVGNKRDLPKSEKKIKEEDIKKFYLDNNQEFMKLSAKDKSAIDGMFKKLIENICSENQKSMNKSKNILSASLLQGNPYGSQSITQTGISRNHKGSLNTSHQENFYCDNHCTRCTIF